MIESESNVNFGNETIWDYGYEYGYYMVLSGLSFFGLTGKDDLDYHN